jgi:hypothetical protein
MNSPIKNEVNKLNVTNKSRSTINILFLSHSHLVTHRNNKYKKLNVQNIIAQENSNVHKIKLVENMHYKNTVNFQS